MFIDFYGFLKGQSDFSISCFNPRSHSNNLKSILGMNYPSIDGSCT